VKNKALEYEEEDINSFEPTNVEVKKYRAFVSDHPNQHTYYQPILDVLEYRPSNLEAIRDVIMVEGKNDFYTLSYFQNIIFKSERTIPILPGTSASNLDTVIQLYYAWGRKFIVLLDGDNEGKKQKKRYSDNFGSIVTDRIFTLGDVDSSWEGYTTEKLFESVDALNIQKSVYRDEEKINKKLLNLALQENLINSNSVDISRTTEDRFKKLLAFLSNALEK
jgi:predicted ATP-dependent endonuclease of OLD family